MHSERIRFSLRAITMSSIERLLQRIAWPAEIAYAEGRITHDVFVRLGRKFKKTYERVSMRTHFESGTTDLPDAKKHESLSVLVILLLPLLVNLPSLLGWWGVDSIRLASGYGSGSTLMLRGFPWIDPNVGITAQALGKLSADEWLHGRIPWWNYYSGVGLPLAAEMQPGALFLPFVLLNHFANGLVYIKVILQILAGLGTYFLLKKIGLRWHAALTGAILYQFNGVFTWHGAPIMSPVAFLPWLVLGVETVREASIAGIAGGWLTIALSLAFSIYAGFPEVAYINGLLAGVWFLWRVFSVPARIGFRFIKKLATGVIVGLLLSVPIIFPFAEYVGQSYSGAHNTNTGFAGIGLPKEALAQMFFPWLYGGIWSYFDPSNIAFTVWCNVGGFLSAGQLSIIAFALFATRRTGLYIVLLLWILVSLGRTFGLPFVSSAVDFIPLLKQTMFYRYSPPSWEFCSAVLCAIVINDVGSGRFRSDKKFILGLLFAFSVVGISLYPAWGLVRDLSVQSGYNSYLWVSLSWGFGSMAIAAVCFKLANDRPLMAAHAMAGLLAVDAIALFSVPLFSGATSAFSSFGGLKYLKEHAGTGRFYTLAPIVPNYGAYFRIASINHAYLPVAQRWVEYIRNHLDPYIDPVNFTGSCPRSDPSAQTQGEVLRDRLAEYEETGVRYVVTPHEENPFRRISTLNVLNSGDRSFNLANEESVDGEISGSQFIGNNVSSISILIGNWDGRSDGVLKIRLSANGWSALGERNLKESQDGQFLVIQLNQPITLVTGELHYEIKYTGGTTPVALRIFPFHKEHEMHRSPKIPEGYAPQLSFVSLDKQADKHPLVFESSSMDIYELSGAKPYFDVIQGRAKLHGENRSVVTVDSASEARLIRRELYYPGWKASTGGNILEIEPYNEIFQSIKIPPGKYKVIFTYTPTNSRVILTLFLLGVFLLITGGALSRTKLTREGIFHFARRLLPFRWCRSSCYSCWPQSS
jgi:hypothetical protein